MRPGKGRTSASEPKQAHELKTIPPKSPFVPLLPSLPKSSYRLAHIFKLLLHQKDSSTVWLVEHSSFATESVHSHLDIPHRCPRNRSPPSSSSLLCMTHATFEVRFDTCRMRCKDDHDDVLDAVLNDLNNQYSHGVIPATKRLDSTTRVCNYTFTPRHDLDGCAFVGHICESRQARWVDS